MAQQRWIAGNIVFILPKHLIPLILYDLVEYESELGQSERKMTEQRVGSDDIAQQAADNLDAAEDIGGFVLTETLKSLLKVIDPGVAGRELVQLMGESLKIPGL